MITDSTPPHPAASFAARRLAKEGEMNQKLPDNETKFVKVLILLAWEAGELSEAQAVAALQMPTVQARELRMAMIETGVELHTLLQPVAPVQRLAKEGKE